jgi:hypothetical protein
LYQYAAHAKSPPVEPTTGERPRRAAALMPPAMLARLLGRKAAREHFRLRGD